MPGDAPRAPEARVDEVLPPEKKRSPGHDALSEFIARIMDELFHIPGTTIKIGLDPIIGLIPVAGGLVSSLLSLLIVADGWRRGMPAFALVRMIGNVLFNALLDAVPVVGDAASIFFRSNSRNVALIERWKSGDQRAVHRSSKALVITLLIAFLVVLGGMSWLVFHSFLWMWQQITT